MLCKDNYNFYYLENHAEDIADDYQKISNFVKYHFGNSDNYNAKMIEAIKFYTSEEYRDLNKRLRKDEPLNDEQLRNSQTLIDVISKTETTENFIVYRGVALSKKEMKKMNLLTKSGKINIGGKYTDDAFISTSISCKTAFSFAARSANEYSSFFSKKQKIVFEIRIKTKTSILPLATYSKYSKEYEFLLNCHTSFKIVGGKIKKDSYCFVLEV